MSLRTTTTPFTASTSSAQVVDADPFRSFLFIQNNGSDAIYVNFGSAASTANIKVDPGEVYEPRVPSTSSVHIISASGSQAGIVIASGLSILVSGGVAGEEPADTTNPTVTISSSAGSSGSTTSTSPIPFTVTFSEAVTGFTSGDVSVTNGSISGFSGSGSTYTFNVTPSGDVTVSVSISGGVCTDAAGNPNNASSTYQITYSAPASDTTAPTAAITYSPSGPYKSGTVVTITATFSEPMADSPVPRIALSGANTLAATNMTKVSTTQYTYSHTVGSGNGTTTVALSNGQDIAGNTVTSAPTSGATFTVDNVAPTASLAYSPAGPYNSGDVVTITATFSEAMADSPVPRIALSGGQTLAATNMTKSSTTVYTYQHTVTSGDGTVTAALSNGTDLAGNVVTSAPTSGATFTVDNTNPSVTITSPVGASGSSTSTSPISFTATFTESVTGFVVGDITVTGGTAGNFAGSGTTYTFDVTPSGNGTVSVSISGGVAQDSVGNGNNASSTFTVEYTAGGSNPFSGIAAGSAQNYSGNNLMSVGVTLDPAIDSNSPLTTAQWNKLYPGGSNKTIFTAYSGASYDSQRKRLIFAGNGHGDSYGNEWYGWKTSDQLFERINNPSVFSGDYATETDDGYLDGTSKPSARHTYDGIAYLPNIDRYFLSGSAVGHSATSNAFFWLYNPNNDTWTEIAGSGDADWDTFANCTAYDPTSGKLFVFTRLALFSIDPTNLAGGWTKHISWRWTYGLDYNTHRRTMVVHDADRKIVLFGNSEVWVFDISNLGAVTMDSSGSGWSGSGFNTLKGYSGPGLTYDSTREEIVGWWSGSTIFIVDVAAKTVTTETLTGDTPTGPTDGGVGTTGVYGRLQYIEEYDVYVAVPGWQPSAFQPVSVFKRA